MVAFHRLTIAFVSVKLLAPLALDFCVLYQQVVHKKIVGCVVITLSEISSANWKDNEYSSFGQYGVEVSKQIVTSFGLNVAFYLSE